MIEIEAIRKRNRPERIAITEHARVRPVERGIAVGDVVQCLAKGEIIRQYEDDKPFPSCLVLGRSQADRPLHMVVSLDEDFIYLITAYYPDTQIWEADFKTRKEPSK